MPQQSQPDRSEHLVVLVTAASEDEARRIARDLLERKLAACVNFVPIRSMFVWEGAIQEEAETLMIIKSRAGAFEPLMAAVHALHSYDLPEVIGLPIVLGSREYLKWIDDETNDAQRSS